MYPEKIHIGTSGWNYKHWKGPFYPEKIMNADILGFYTHHFKTVEINNSFYRLPADKTLHSWRDNTPEGFLFTIKASRYLTHMKKLKDPAEPLQAFLEKADILGEKLGPILFQLPPRWHCNTERLQSFIDILPEGYRYAFEFRDESWFDAAVYHALAARNIAFCVYHLAGNQSPKQVTADFIYIRLHGPGEAYQGCYDIPTLSGWAGAISTWQRQGREIFCYFDNDQDGFAPKNAQELSGMLEG